MEIYDIMLVGKLTGGGGDAPTGTKNITTNGLHDVAEYASADVNVPNTYTASDEGKVVSNGALVGQTSATKTENGTYDTTLNNEVVVNVPQPSGTVNITQNGTVDVTNYASADVNVSGGGDSTLIDLIERNATNIVIPNGVTKIGKGAFYYSKNATITIPSSVTNIDEYAFRYAQITSMNIPSSVTSIGDYAFSDCSALASVNISNAVTSIGKYAFSSCSSLASAIIGNGVTDIGARAFDTCRNLRSITIYATTPPTINSTAFTNVPSDANIYVPSASVEAYKTASNWSSRASYIQAIPE